MCFATVLLFSSCSQGAQEAKTQKEIIEMETIENEIEQISDEIDSETEDMNHDVDSLLEGI